MLTLGLVEGVLSATIGMLLLVGAANENAPLHKILGPLVVGVVGIAAYLAHDAGAMHEVADVVGLGFFVVIAFFVPLAVMRTAWKLTRAIDGAPDKRTTRTRETIAASSDFVVHEGQRPEAPRKVA
jgi:hypothetical protein